MVGRTVPLASPVQNSSLWRMIGLRSTKSENGCKPNVFFATNGAFVTYRIELRLITLAMRWQFFEICEVHFSPSCDVIGLISFVIAGPRSHSRGGGRVAEPGARLHRAAAIHQCRADVRELRPQVQAATWPWAASLPRSRAFQMRETTGMQENSAQSKWMFDEFHKNFFL